MILLSCTYDIKYQGKGEYMMRAYSFAELSQKEVINLCTGEKMGRICDIEISAKDHTVISIVLPGQGSLLGLGKATETVIPWCKIECVGEDTVLIKLSAEEQSACCVPKRKMKHRLFGG